MFKKCVNLFWLNINIKLYFRSRMYAYFIDWPLPDNKKNGSFCR